jgi:hypothetical protein
MTNGFAFDLTLRTVHCWNGCRLPPAVKACRRTDRSCERARADSARSAYWKYLRSNLRRFRPHLSQFLLQSMTLFGRLRLFRQIQ